MLSEGFGTPDWIRTSGLQSRSLTRYPTAPRAHTFLYHGSISERQTFVKRSPVEKIVKNLYNFIDKPCTLQYNVTIENFNFSNKDVIYYEHEEEKCV